MGHPTPTPTPTPTHPYFHDDAPFRVTKPQSNEAKLWPPDARQVTDSATASVSQLALSTPMANPTLPQV